MDMHDLNQQLSAAEQAALDDLRQIGERDDETSEISMPNDEMMHETDGYGGLDIDQERVATLENEVESLKSQLLRSFADLQNYRRRNQEQSIQLQKFANEEFVRNIIPVIDNFDRTLAAIQEGGDMESIKQGVVMIHRQLLETLSQAGVSKIASAGAQFDPEIHEAIDTWDSPDHEEGIITDEISSGYKLADRVIRPARVRVSRHG